MDVYIYGRMFNGCVHMERVVQLGEVFILGEFPLEFNRGKVSSLFRKTQIRESTLGRFFFTKVSNYGKCITIWEYFLWSASW